MFSARSNNNVCRESHRRYQKLIMNVSLFFCRRLSLYGSVHLCVALIFPFVFLFLLNQRNSKILIHIVDDVVSYLCPIFIRIPHTNTHTNPFVLATALLSTGVSDTQTARFTNKILCSRNDGKCLYMLRTNRYAPGKMNISSVRLFSHHNISEDGECEKYSEIEK